MLERAIGQRDSVLASVRTLLRERKAVAEISSTTITTDPTFRLLRTQLISEAMSLRTIYKRRVLWAILAFELEANTGFGLDQVRLLGASSAKQVKGFRQCLSDHIDTFRATYGTPQPRVTELSLKHDVFGIARTYR